MTRCAALLCLTAVSVGCSAPIDQQKFDGVYRAGKAMEGAMSVGVNALRYRELLQSFASEVSIANDRATSQNEREMVSQYAVALRAFKDAETLWAKKLKGIDRVILGEEEAEIGRIATSYDYNIPGKGTGSNFSFEIDSAIQELWRVGGRRLKEANRIYTGASSPELLEPQ